MSTFKERALYEPELMRNAMGTEYYWAWRREGSALFLLWKIVISKYILMTYSVCVFIAIICMGYDR
jgi:hypothetical protein